MIRKIILLLGIAMWIISCQQDDQELDMSGGNTNNGDGIPVKISLSIEDGIDNQTGYIPMKVGTEDEVKLKISNLYRIIIMKKIGNKIIIDSLATGIADNSLREWDAASFKKGDNLSDLSLVLTPGEYYLSIFTGFNKLMWNSHIKKGGVVADDSSDGTHDYACTYGIGATSYSNVGVKYVSEEIFSGTTHFIVNKTEDLHSNPDPVLENIKVTLKRNVTKYRMVLHDYDGVDPNDAFESNFSEPIIRGNMTALNGTKFVDGLDIWGDPWYDQDTPTTEMEYCTETKSSMITFGNERYYFSTHGTRVHAPYFFSKEGDEVEVRFSNLRVYFGSNSRYYRYNETIDATLMHNNVDGIIFTPGSETDDNVWPPVTNMNLEMNGAKPKNPLDIFNSYAEFNFLQTP
ncbi:MAG: hypothetical protein LBV71_00975 [Prevotella sp.]|jgi:hypothetical protein|nr:hypothetical protein [Prevotella sp.]